VTRWPCGDGGPTPADAGADETSALPVTVTPRRLRAHDFSQTLPVTHKYATEHSVFVYSSGRYAETVRRTIVAPHFNEGGVSKEEIVMATATQEAYCVKCRQKRPMKDAQEVTMKNGRRALKGQCEVCNTNMTLMLGNKQPA